ncbi:class I SAM-dependent methyltransferase [Lacinutrix sp. MEBiC02404]
MKGSYKNIVNHYEECFKEHGDNHLGVDWPNLEDAIKRYQVMLAVIRETEVENSVLDFGCGTAHLYQFIQDNSIKNINYSGLDLSHAFVDAAKNKFPSNSFYCLDILKDTEDLPEFDYLICNGVFTEKRELSFDAMWSYFQEMLEVLFSKTNKGIAFNVMSKSVDWERWDLFHLPTDLLIDFITKKISRNFVIRNDYGLYEYTVYIYK